MNQQVLILSEDAVFARMLELEIRLMRLTVAVKTHFEEGDSAEIFLLDLDTVPPPEQNASGFFIGYTRNPAIMRTDTHRQCDLLLRRPFDMELLDREIRKRLSGAENVALPKTRKIQPVLEEQARLLRYGEETVALSGKECALLRLLLDDRGKDVSKEALNAAIGDNGTNKLEVYICHLRKKLEFLSPTLRLRTVRERGYRLEE